MIMRVINLSFHGWRGIARRVIVAEDQGLAGHVQRGFNDLPGLYHTSSKAPGRYQVGADRFKFGVQHQHHEIFTIRLPEFHYHFFDYLGTGGTIVD
jgi:hypothetical protein